MSGYDIHLDDKYGSLALIDIPAEIAHQGYTIPKGIVHRTRAPERTSILMVEAAGVVPTGDGVRASGPNGLRGN